MTIGEIVKQYREEHGLSQRQFAEQCGDITNGYISMLEQGKNPSTGKPIVPSIDKVASLARAMGMTIHQLFDMADDSPVSTGESEKLYQLGKQLTAQAAGLSDIEFALYGVTHELSENGKIDLLQFARFIHEQETKAKAAHDD